ncbi:MAG: efflux transporter outer membrane subunit [bacterium]|nr:efflux transporter outer membrane subunit [bacterium]
MALPMNGLPRRLLLVLLLAASGCTSTKEYINNGFKVGPNYNKPAAPVSNDWIDSSDPRLESTSPDLSQWWTAFNDPVLNQIIYTAHSQNLTLREAGYRVLEARSQRDVAVGGLFPQTQQATADYARTQRSLANVPPGIPASALGPRNISNWSVGGQLAWELDFWGRFRRSIEAADASLDASIENYDDAIVMLLAETANTYVEIRTTEQRLEYARQNVVIQAESARVAVARFDNKAKDSELDAPQAKANLYRTEAAIEALEIALRQSKNRLCVLLGMPPHEIDYMLGGPSSIPSAPKQVAVGIPAELLQRRPDVRRAERQVAAQSAEIGIAESDLYPQISVNGSLSLEAQQFNKMFDSRAWAGSIGPQFRWNILNYGRIINTIAVQDARLQAATTNYQQTVLLANEEAENAMVAFLRYQKNVEKLIESEREAKEAVRVATAKYEAGDFDYNRLFTVQEFLVTQQDRLATGRGNLASSLVQLYRAMGGGWEIRFDPANAATQLEPAPPAEGIPQPINEPPPIDDLPAPEAILDE